MSQSFNEDCVGAIFGTLVTGEIILLRPPDKPQHPVFRIDTGCYCFSMSNVGANVIKCVACNLGRKWECLEHGTCSCGVLSSGDDLESAFGDYDPSLEIETYKLDSELKDQQSTGRKRAAKLYPLDTDAPCEWQRQKNCGGGNNPITGCANGTQKARHHGPDKNTLNNERGNVHRICPTCHNRWHAANDSGYVWGSTYPKHAPEVATDDDILANEFIWMQRGKLQDVSD